MPVEGVRANREAEAAARAAEREARRVNQNTKHEEIRENKRAQNNESKGAKVDTEA